MTVNIILEGTEISQLCSMSKKDFLNCLNFGCMYVPGMGNVDIWLYSLELGLCRVTKREQPLPIEMFVNENYMDAVRFLF